MRFPLILFLTPGENSVACLDQLLLSPPDHQGRDEPPTDVIFCGDHKDYRVLGSQTVVNGFLHLLNLLCSKAKAEDNPTLHRQIQAYKSSGAIREMRDNQCLYTSAQLLLKEYKEKYDKLAQWIEKLRLKNGPEVLRLLVALQQAEAFLSYAATVKSIEQRYQCHKVRCFQMCRDPQLHSDNQQIRVELNRILDKCSGKVVIVSEYNQYESFLLACFVGRGPDRVLASLPVWGKCNPLPEAVDAALPIFVLYQKSSPEAAALKALPPDQQLAAATRMPEKNTPQSVQPLMLQSGNPAVDEHPVQCIQSVLHSLDCSNRVQVPEAISSIRQRIAAENLKLQKPVAATTCQKKKKKRKQKESQTVGAEHRPASAATSSAALFVAPPELASRGGAADAILDDVDPDPLAAATAMY